MSSSPLSAWIQSRKNASPTAPADSAFRSIPEEKARPSPVTTTTQASASVPAASTAAASSAASCASSAFSTWGRVSVIQPTPSTASYRTCAPGASPRTYPSTALRPRASRASRTRARPATAQACGPRTTRSWSAERISSIAAEAQMRKNGDA